MCADVKYGISRTFATTQITGGSTNAIALLDVPRNPDGSSTYAGPYLKTGQAGFDKAVTCAGQTITFMLARPVPDFNQVVALSAFGPVREDKDRRVQSATEIFSNGPYMLKTAWRPSTGGTFVRNPHWDMASDPIRKARPAQILYQEGTPVETALSTIMKDGGSDSFEVTGDSAPPVLQHNTHVHPGDQGSVDEPARAVRGLPAAQLQPADDGQPEGAAGAGPGHQPRGLRHGPRWRHCG